MHLYRTITYVTVLFLFCFLVSWAQEPIGITTSVGNSVAITICDGDTVTFTLDEVSGIAEGYIFYRIRGGLTSIVQHNSANRVFTTSSIEDGDIYYGERYDYDFSGDPIITDEITFTVQTLSGPSFSGGTIDQTSQFNCPGMPGLNLTVTGGATGTNYIFQWQRSIDNGVTYSDIPGATGEMVNTGTVTQTTYFRRRVMHNGSGTCEKFSTEYIYEISDLSPGSLDMSSNQSICYDTSPGTLGSGSSVLAFASRGTITYQWQQNTGSGWIDIPGEINNVFTPPNLTNDIQYRRFATNSTSSGSCGYSTNVISIDVEVQIIGGTTTGEQTICNGEIPSTLQLTGATSGVGIVSQWQSSSDGVNFNDILGVTGTLLTFTASSTYTPFYTTYFRVRTGTLTPSCSVYSSVTTVTVLPENVGLTSSALNGIYCSGDDIEFEVTGDDSTYSFYLDGFPLLTNSTTPTYTLRNLTGNHLFSFEAMTSSGCSRQIDINLIENNIEAGSIEGDQLVCTGATPQEITSVMSATVGGLDIGGISSASYQWQSSFDSNIWANIMGATDENYTPPSTIPQSIYLRRVATNTISGVTCQDFSNTVYVQKVDSIEGGIISPSSQSLCSSGSSTPLVVSGGTAAVGVLYQWESAVYPGGTFSAIGSATQASYTPSAPLVSMQYRRLVYSSTSSVCSAYSSIHVLHPVDLDPGSLDPSQSTSVFHGTSPGVIGNGATGGSAMSSNASITYQWEQSVNGGTWTGIPGATGDNYTPSGLTQNTQFRRRAIANFSGSSCSSVTNAITVTISNLLNAGRVEQDQIICNIALPNDLILTGAASGTDISYEWQISTDNVTFQTISNTTNRLSFTSTTTWNPQQDLTYYRVKVVDVLSGNTVFSSPASITLLPISVSLNSNAVMNTFCVGDDVTFTASGTGSLTYEFFVNGISYQGPGTDRTYTHNFTSTSTVTLLAINEFGCTRRVDLLMTENYVTSGIISGTQTICKGEIPTTLVSSMEGTALGTDISSSTTGSYQWQSSFTGSSSWTNILGANQEFFSNLGALNQTTYFRRLSRSELNGLVCSDPSNVIEVTVLEVLQRGSIDQSDQYVCEGDQPLTLSVSNGSAGVGIIYQWEQSVGVVSNVFSPIFGATGENYIPPVLTETTRFRRRTTAVPGGCVEYSNIHTIWVNDINPGLLDTSQNTSICFGSEIPILSSGATGQDASSSLGMITYQWQDSPDGGVWSDVLSATSVFYQPDPFMNDRWFRRIAYSTVSTSVCSRVTNSILIEVQPQIDVGLVSAPQRICEGDTFNDLSITNTTPPLGVNYQYQWQSSSNNVDFVDIPGENNLILSGRILLSDTYFRCLVIATGAINCIDSSESILIDTDPLHTLIVAGTGNSMNQTICPTEPISPIELRYGGGASDISIPDLSIYGLSVSHNVTNSLYTISGVPSSTVSFNVFTIPVSGNVCTPESISFQIQLEEAPAPPNQIYIDGSLVFDNNAQVSFPLLCYGTNTSQFSVEYINLLEETASLPNWELVSPLSAGVIDANTGLMTWNVGFSGSAIFRVRGQSSCSSSVYSSWTNTFQIDVASLNLPPIPPSPIRPIQVGTVSFTGGFSSGGDPVCPISVDTPDTQYQVPSLTNTNTIQTTDIVWTMEVITIGNASSSSAGSIDPNTGLVDWNPGFWGTVNIYADPINCSGENDPRNGPVDLTLRQIYTVNIPDTISPFVDIHLDPSSSLPKCPAQTASFTTTFFSNLSLTQSITWFINNSNAGTIDPNTGILTWAPDFSGRVDIIAQAGTVSDVLDICDVSESRITLTIPDEAEISLVSGFNSNIVNVCADVMMPTIRYELTGAAEGIEVNGLPNGITGVLRETPQMSQITFSGTSNSPGEVYIISLPLQNYVYTTQASGESASYIVQQLASFLSSDPTVEVSTSGPTIVFEARTAGNSFQVLTEIKGITPQVSVSNVTTVPLERIYEISGSTNATAGTYSYTLMTTNTSSVCHSAIAEGVINVRPSSEIVLTTSNDGQIVCNNTPMNQMVYRIDFAQNALVDPPTLSSPLQTDGLPNGVIASYFGGNLLISGTPVVSLTDSITYTFTIRTFSNSYGCEEAIATGSITVLPDKEIELITHANTQNQQVCEGVPIDTIQYDLSAPIDPSSNSFDFSNLPPGVGVVYDSGLRRLTISGTPNPNPELENIEIYSYSMTVSGCSGSQTITDTITVYPKARFELDSALGTDAQTVCGGESIEEISYQMHGATGIDHTVTPFASWLSFLIDPVDQKIVIRGTPNFIPDQEVSYTYTITPISSPFGCNDGNPIQGVITVIPPQNLEIASGIDSLEQEICNGEAIEEIVLTFNENVLGATVSGLPNGLSVNTNHYNREYSMDVVGSNSPSGETYEVRINSNSYSFTTTQTTSPIQLAEILANLINNDSSVSASDDGLGKITIRALNSGDTFSVTTSNSSLYAFFINKTVNQSHGELVISGIPLSSNATDTIYNFAVSTSGINCSPYTVSGSIQVDASTEVTLGSLGTDNQTVCSQETISPIVYSFSGSEPYSVSINGLPPGISGYFDPIAQEFLITGAPTVRNSLTISYPYYINIISNPGICDPIVVSGQISVSPFESFELVSAPETPNQIVCIDDPLVDIEYEVTGSISSVILSSGSFPSGISGNLIPQNLILETVVSGSPTVLVSETFSIRLNNSSSYTYESPSAGISAETIAQELVNLINPNPVVTATQSGGIIRLEGKVPGDFFTIITENGPFNTPLIGMPTLIQSNLKYVISGTPSLSISSQTIFPFGIESSGSSCITAAASGTITVNVNSDLELISSATTSSQTVCDLSPISRIEYEVSQGATGATISWSPYVPSGINWNFDSTNNLFYIEGTPDLNSGPTEIYSYTVSTTGNVNGCNEVGLSGTIKVSKTDQILLLSGSGTDQQNICEILGAPIQNIIYELTGTATNLIVTGLPNGLTSSFDASTKQLTISGSFLGVSTPTTFYYEVIPSYSECRALTVSGSITIGVLPEVELTSSLQTTNQVGINSVCIGEDIEPITYQFGSAVSTITVENLPPGVVHTVNGNVLTISGVALSNGLTSNRVYEYNILLNSNNGCLPSTPSTGMIEVIPNPTIDNIFITANDIQNISCNGANDGAILIPSESPDFDRRISGNQNSVRQIDHVVLTNDPLVSDVYSISIDGTIYSHTVIPVSFGGPIQNARQTAQELIEIINSATGAQEAPVIASLTGVSTIALTAKVLGNPFLVDQVTIQTIGGGSGTISTTTIVENRSLGYSFSWTGPNGFISSDLGISNLAPGDYFLTVSVNDCKSTTATFTITEPDPITIDTEMCNGALNVQVEGGTPPYTIELFDSNSILIETSTTNNSRVFSNLTPGSNYRIEVFDSVCDLAVQQAIQLPFELTLNQSGITVVDDYCNDSEGSGFIELGGNAGGEAFSGGSGQFSYRWTGPSFTASSRDIYNLEPGIYTVTVTDEVLGCTDQAVFEVGSVDPLVINLDPSINLDATGAIALACEGDEDGAIEISVNGGLGNYSYSWTRNGNVIAGATGLRIEDLGIGRYEVTVTDTPPSGIAPNLPNCQATRVFEVKGPQPISVFVNSSTGSTTFYCPSENGTASFEVEIFGGTPPFTVELTAENGSISTHSVPSNSATTLEGLRPEIEGETYQVKVIDSNNCESQKASTTLNFQSIEAVTLRPQVTQIDCSRGVLGSITLDLVNGQISNPEQVQIQWRSANANIYDTWANSNGVLENIETGGTYQVVVTQGTCELFRADDIQVTDVVEQMLFINNIDVQSGGCNGDLGRIELDLRGGFPPIQIEWEQYKVVNSITGATSTTTGSTTSRLEWVTLPQYQNNAIATDLEVGTYRARISDGANTVEGVACGGPQTTNPIAIGATAFELANFRIENGTVCDTASATASIYFTVLNTLPNTNNNEFTPKIMLDAKELGNDLISLGNDNYRIVNIASGNHTLNITTGTSTAVLGSYANCSINHPFEIESPLPIRYGGATQFDLDACAAFTQISVDPTLVTGGAPYQIDNNILYDYSWSYTPFSDGDPTLIPQTYVGDTIFEASPGTYELTISDSVNCSSEPIVFVLNASDSTEPFSIEGILQEVSSEDSNTIIEQVKVLPPNCMSTRSNGQIGIEISGGLRPYTIEWYKEEIQSETVTASSSVELVRLEGATNSTHLQNLEPGKYQLVIRSQNQECSQDTQINSNNYYEEFFVVPNNEELYIIDGPNIGDVNLCRLSPGIISIQVFDNSNGELSFYYNNELVNLSEDQPIESNTYNLLIENPVPYAELLISNESGCSVSTFVEIAEIAPPEFDYTSPSIRASGSILAREEILFENNSPLPYSYSIWHFGDGSSERVSSNTLSPTTHAYGISGTYYVTLRNYNSLGCFEETTREIVIGNGYNVMAPNAFSPNGDGINDFYRPLFSGFARVVLRIYDDRGNILYTEEVEESNSTEITGIKLEGWNGENAPLAPYYIYHFTGYLITDETEITRTGTFVIIK